MVLGDFTKGTAKSVGKNVAGSRAGRRLIRQQLTDAGLDTSKKNMDEYGTDGLITGHLRPFRAIGSIGNDFAASISSSLSPSRGPPGLQK